MICLICNKSESVSFRADYKLEIKSDKKFFENQKIYSCKECDFSFVNPMPKDDKINYFYKNIYRSVNRPPYWMTENYDDIKNTYLDDRNLNYLLYLTTLVDIKKIKNLFDFGAGYGDLGFAIKKNFPKVDLFCSENDDFCKPILNEKNYKNFENLNDINIKFDLIITLHTLEHLTDINIFSKFYELLNKNGSIFFEVPNCPDEYFQGRPYDSPHLLFYTKRSIEKIANIYNMNIKNFSFSYYSFEDDHQYQRESQNLYENLNKNLSFSKIKKIVKKITPKFLINFRRDLINTKQVKSDDRINLYSNNTGNNCYIRGILTKK